MNTLISTANYGMFKTTLSKQIKNTEALQSYTFQLMKDSIFYEAKFQKEGVLFIRVPRNRKIGENLFPKDGQTLQREETELRQIMATLAPGAIFKEPQNHLK